MKKKVIIIDDESLAVSIVQNMLKAIDGFEVVETCSNGFEGLKAIQQHQPDLIFLDIQMPKINGFEMLELIDNPPQVIFTTAFDEYAIKAFEANALDYLLKPFSNERFEAAVQKFQDYDAVAGKNISHEVVASINYPAETKNRIVVKSGNDIRIIPVDEIQYIEAYDDYIKVNIKGDCFLKKQTMIKTEKMLPDSQFIRVHRSFIINISAINRLELSGKDSYNAILRDHTIVPLSRPGYGRLKEILGI